MLCNYHVHSEYSDDSIYPIEDVVKDAIELNINEICFTDHVDFGIKKDFDHPEYPATKPHLTNVDYKNYVKSINYLKDKYKDLINIKTGIEFGIQTHTLNKCKEVFDSYHFDFVILSIHQINDLEFDDPSYVLKFDNIVDAHLSYYEEMYECMLKYKDYSVLGHLDMIDRYIENIDFKYVKDIIEKILKLAIKDGKGIELNTSHIRYRLNKTTPSKEILKMYYDLGGRIITIGSDSHSKEHLGFWLSEAKEYLKSIGFKEYCTFKDMKPIFHSLDD